MVCLFVHRYLKVPKCRRTNISRAAGPEMLLYVMIYKSIEDKQFKLKE